MTLAHNVIGTLAGRQAGAGGEAQSINIHDYGSDGKSLSCGSLSLFSPPSSRFTRDPPRPKLAVGGATECGPTVPSNMLGVPIPHVT